MSLEGMGPSLTVEGATTAVVFEAYVEQVLAPSLQEGQVVVMDNLGAHRPKRIRELIEQRGCELVYLPAYSPDYNPIEEAFAKIKNLLRKAAARTKEVLVEAIGAALCRRSAPKTLGASSSMPDTALRVSYCETCCQASGLALRYLFRPRSDDSNVTSAHRVNNEGWSLQPTLPDG